MKSRNAKRLAAVAAATTRATLAIARVTGRTAQRIPWRRLRPRTRRHAGVLGVLLLATLWFTVGGEVAAAGDTWDRRELLDAIRWVESSHRDHVPDGDNGRAIGPYQIHYVYWLDASSFDPELGSDYQRCRQRDYAERVIDAYMRRYIPSAWRDGHGETIARVHNGGPKGYQKAATDHYWQRVRQRLPAPHSR